MIDEALEFLRAGKSRSNGYGKAVGRPLVTGQDMYELAKPTEGLIRQYPAAALATAFLLGVAIAWWVKRR